MSDLRFALRQLRKSPGFTLMAVVTLALGIMATTAIYSVIYAVILDPFPYKDVDHLMSVNVWDVKQPNNRRSYYSIDQFIEIDERNTIFEGVVASTISDVLWSGAGDPQRLRGNYGTPNTFQIIGVPPLLGRTFDPSDVATGSAPVAVLGYRCWQTQFGGDRSVIGRQLRLNDQVRTVVGVMPKRFMWRGADVYLPLVLERGKIPEGVQAVHLLGRIKPGVTPAQAETNLRPIIEELKQHSLQEFPEQWAVGIRTFKETFPSDIQENLWILLGAVTLLLAIACANVSNLLLSRASGRQKEMAVRAALGATRARLVRQLLLESLALGVAGGVLGVALAFGALRGILALVPPGTIPDESEIALNLPVLLFTLILSIFTSLLFGLVPALHASPHGLANSLREAARGLSGGSRQALFRKTLVSVEVALALMLLVGAALMIRTFIKMQDVDLGFRAERLLGFRIPLNEKNYPDAERRNLFFTDLLERLRALPGVTAVGLNTGAHPFGNRRVPVETSAGPVEGAENVLLHQVNHDYLNAFAIPILTGRAFTQTEINQRRLLAIVNDRFVRARLQGQNPIGQIVRIPALRQLPGLRSPAPAEADTAFEIIGVSRTTINRGITQEALPEIYIPYTIGGVANIVVMLTDRAPEDLTRSALATVYAIDRNQPVTNVRTIDQMLSEGVFAAPRFNLELFSLFAVLGLILAVIGVYGVMANTVAQQTHEIGIRMSLGASPRDVLKMVINRGLKLIIAGTLIGLVGSFFASRLIARQLWNVSPFDPVAFGAVSLILMTTGILACLWPAWRAARIDPTVALRQE